MYIKSVVLFAWFGLAYSIVVFAPVPFFVRLLAVIPLGLAGAGIGFSVMHDAGHGSYSKNSKFNQLMFYSLDFLGGSSYVWRFKHNTLHHTYANIEGHDDDINMGILGRLAEGQRHVAAHRFQHIYVWFLYGMIGVKWHFYDDFATWYAGRLGDREMPRPRGKDAVALIVGKLVFLSVCFVIPSFFHHIGWVILFYLMAAFVEGVALAVVFQLAHCVEEADFPLPDEAMRMQTDWATHQVLTTVDFAPNNRLLSWYVGGLNFQIEHHLFPKITHVHYPAIAEIVRETCNEFAIPYRVQPTFFGGVRSHYRFLRRMGRTPEAGALLPAASA
ncbi:MAG: acyl-CoA desaturase [Bradymonadaceae bacterium]|nr:acyl-CoA desaturase [Lujinxingiaceae bacterium]